ncbi:MAG: hypothetical protein FalmKO_30640 [Falsiruegeria mediterranea]
MFGWVTVSGVLPPIVGAPIGTPSLVGPGASLVARRGTADWRRLKRIAGDVGLVNGQKPVAVYHVKPSSIASDRGTA